MLHMISLQLLLDTCEPTLTRCNLDASHKKYIWRHQRRLPWKEILQRGWRKWERATDCCKKLKLSHIKTCTDILFLKKQQQHRIAKKILRKTHILHISFPFLLKEIQLHTNLLASYTYCFLASFLDYYPIYYHAPDYTDDIKFDVWLIHHWRKLNVMCIVTLYPNLK